MPENKEWQHIQVSGFIKGTHPISFDVPVPWEPESASEWFTPKDGKFYIRNTYEPNSEVSYWRAYEGNPPESAQGLRLRLWMLKQRLLGRCTKKHRSL